MKSKGQEREERLRGEIKGLGERGEVEERDERRRSEIRGLSEERCRSARARRQWRG